MIESVHNLHCPTCDARLLEEAGRFQVLGEVRGEPGPVKYVVDGNRAPVCPADHPLPDVAALYAYRDSKGYPPEAPAREVPWPYRPR